jgi:putative methanogenesis marker 13 metalloprotein
MFSLNMESTILHPRPNAIAAALFTLRDLEVDVAVLHGPPGCNYKLARMLEEDGLHVVTTAMDESDYIFGAGERLSNTLRRVISGFNPESIAVVGTCASMIIGEDMKGAVEELHTDIPVLIVDIHAGYHDNIIGVIRTLEAARNAGIISESELSRQKRLMQAAMELEKRKGAASSEYIPPSRGDIKYTAARRLITLMKEGRKGAVVLNAKKETVYMFADILLAVSQAASHFNSSLTTIANLEKKGLPRIQRYAEEVRSALEEHHVSIDHLCGGLDEYATIDTCVRRHLTDAEYVVIAGIPHAVTPPEYAEVFSITNGPRLVAPLKKAGHHHVLVEVDLHPKTLGVHSIVESEFGATLRTLLQG